MRRVVVTGLGCVNAVGNDLESAWKQTLAGESGVDLITHFDPSALTVKIAAQVKNFDIGDSMDHKEARRVSGFIKYAMKASQEALQLSGLDTSTGTERWGCSIGAGIGAIDEIEKNTVILNEKGPKRVSPFFMPYTIANMAAGCVSIKHNLKGPNICTTTACTSGTHAVGEGFLYISQNMADVMVVGGAEASISPLPVAAFAAMKALSTNNDNPKQASRPFDKNRDGFVMGEGAGIMVLEELEHAKKRGAKIYAEVVGYGLSGDANHITAPSPDGEGAQRCMAMALEMGKIPKEEIDYINAHGTSTGLNDKYESAAIGRLFGAAAKGISISSTKGVTGHCLGAAGGIEAVYTAMALHTSLIPPTANYETPDPDCPLDYTPNHHKDKKLRYALSNSFGFGGTNGTIVLKRFD
jgi:3-oxoacyl-[acyl-carrier-protein] synthase II